jgi:gliding motility-associated-like protein
MDSIVGQMFFYFDICQGESIDFQGTWEYKNEQTSQQSVIDSKFNWQYNGDSISTERNFTHIFTQSGIHEIRLDIEDANECTNKVIEKVYVRVSITPSMSIDPQVACIDIETELHAIIEHEPAIRNIRSDHAYPYDELIPPNINSCPDSFYERSIEINSFLPKQKLRNLNDFSRVCINMEHSFVGDLTMELIAPNGNSVVLLADENGSSNGNGLGNNYLGEPNMTPGQGCETTNYPPGIGFDYCWSPNPTDSTWHDLDTEEALGNPIPASNIDTDTLIYSAYNNSFNHILNTPLNGEWTLKVSDLITGDDGFIFNWWIDFDEAIVPANLAYIPNAESFEWTNFNSLISTENSYLFTPSNPGTYSYNLTIEDDFGCKYSDLVSVNVPTKLELLSEISIPDSCENRIGSVTIKGVGGTEPYEYFWTTLGGSGSTASYLRAGSYPYIITDNTNCTYEGVASVDQRGKGITAEFSYELDTCSSELKLWNESANFMNLVWSFGANDSSYDQYLTLPNLGGIYTVQLTASNTYCADTISEVIDLTSTDAYSRIKFPNVFTPNGDFMNDILSINGLRDCESGVLKIFNKWGDEVFYSIYPSTEPWDGKHLGEDVSNGVYFYVLKLNYAQFKGTVSLLR